MLQHSWYNLADKCQVSFNQNKCFQKEYKVVAIKKERHVEKDKSEKNRTSKPRMFST